MEDIPVAYNTRSATHLANIVGDGPVYDPMLDPTDGVVTYPNVAAWMSAADRVNDHFAMFGYTVGVEPVAVHVDRSSDSLRSFGFESVGVSVYVYAQECEHRIVVGPEVVSGDDGCALYSAVGDAGDVDPPIECVSKLGSVGRASHVAVWTGEEMIVWGGTRSLLSDESLRSGMAFDPDTFEWRRIADLDAPDPLFWYGSHAVWTGTDMLVYGPSVDGQFRGFLYDPASDSWSEIAQLPEDDRSYTGASTWTGEELLVWGGDNNYPARDGWLYTPSTDSWESLPESPGQPTEEPEAVWTGNEFVIWGGYPNHGLMYEPDTESWRVMRPSPQADVVQGHAMVWTGEEVLLWGGHGGPGHSAVPLAYDVATDRWRSGASAPLTGRERFPGVWTGQVFVVWGGFATYGEIDDIDSLAEGDGAVYDPGLDEWTVMSPSPLDDRCDHTGVWTGKVVVYFGGYEQCGNLDEFMFGTGAAYDPAADTWTLLPPPPG
jgi:hypothetical protein